MNKLNFEDMSRDELAHYMVAHRDTPDGVRRGELIFVARQVKLSVVGVNSIDLKGDRTPQTAQAIANCVHLTLHCTRR
ncbi:MAG: hypothetical protein ACFB4I_00940 [Cyanophyceae cyanobacterium]